MYHAQAPRRLLSASATTPSRATCAGRDDNADAEALLERLLEMKDYEVRTAAVGEEAIDVVLQPSAGVLGKTPAAGNAGYRIEIVYLKL